MVTAMRIYMAALDKLKIEAIALSLFSMTAESYKYICIIQFEILHAHYSHYSEAKYNGWWMKVAIPSKES